MQNNSEMGNKYLLYILTIYGHRDVATVDDFTNIYLLNLMSQSLVLSL